jgi:hypothetical protein
VVAAFALVASIGLTQSPAGATASDSQGWTYRSSSDCTWGGGWTGWPYGDNAGLAGRTESFRDQQYWFPPWLHVDCDQWWDRPAGYVALKVDLMKWNGSSWGVCAWTTWIYNANNTHAVDYSYVYPLGSAPCGAGYYYTATLHYQLHDAWHGGGLATGYVWSA